MDWGEVVDNKMAYAKTEDLEKEKVMREQNNDDSKKPPASEVRSNDLLSTLVIWEYEDQLPDTITGNEYNAMYDWSQVIIGVRMFPYVEIEGKRYYLRKSR